MNEEQRIAFLKTTRLFEQTPIDVLGIIAKTLSYDICPEGTNIVQKGEAADRMYLVVSGLASVHEGGMEIRTLSTGEGFGEWGMLDNHPRAATVTAVQPCELLSIDRESFLGLVSSRPEISRAILLIFTSNLRSNGEAMAREFAYRLELERKIQEQLRDLAAAQLAMIFALSKLAETRDSVTGLHLERVREYSRILATELGKHEEFQAVINEEYIHTVYTASPLHDIGKVAIPDQILKKPAKLDPSEFEIMKSHTTLGTITLKAVLEQYPANRLVSIGIEIAQSHHEKWDGSGYPQGLSGVAIPLSARIVALADVYDALSSRRPYKEPFELERARMIIQEGRGKHFDPAIVDAFLNVEPDFAYVARTMGDA